MKTYGDIFEYLPTATYSRAELTNYDEVFYIHYGDIHTKWNFFLDIDESSLPTIRNEQVKNYHLLKEGDIIMADASEDYAGICKSVEVKNLGDVKAISGLHTFLLRDKSDFFVNGFRGYIHFNKAVKMQFDRLATGLKVYGVTKGNLKTVKIPVPTKPEQSAIAVTLSDTSALIGSLEKLITKKRKIKQGAMQRLLQPKEGWIAKRLGDYVKITSGESPSKFIFKSSGIPYFKVDQLNNSEKYQVDTPYYVESVNTISKGSIIFPKRGASILLNKVRILSEDSYMDTNLMTLTLSEELNSEFVYYMLINIELWRIADTTSIPQINNKHIIPIEISFPSIEEQFRIATILSDMDAEISALQAKLDKYRMVKMGMMQNLLTGKIRLV